MQGQEREQRLGRGVAERDERRESAGFVGAEAHEARNRDGGRALAGDQRDEHLADGGPGELPETRAGHGEKHRIEPGVLADAQTEGEQQRPQQHARGADGVDVVRDGRQEAEGAARERAAAQPLRQPADQAGGEPDAP